MKIPGIVPDSSDFILSREQMKLLGIIFALLGILECGGTFLIAHSITTHQASLAEQATARTEECSDRLTKLGYQTQIQGDTITAKMTGLGNAAYKLGEASIASLSCQGWHITKFCMGDSCNNRSGGQQLELQSQQPEK